MFILYFSSLCIAFKPILLLFSISGIVLINYRNWLSKSKTWNLLKFQRIIWGLLYKKTLAFLWLFFLLLFFKLKVVSLFILFWRQFIKDKPDFKLEYASMNQILHYVLFRVNTHIISRNGNFYAFSKSLHIKNQNFLWPKII